MYTRRKRQETSSPFLAFIHVLPTQHSLGTSLSSFGRYQFHRQVNRSQAPSARVGMYHVHLMGVFTNASNISRRQWTAFSLRSTSSSQIAVWLSWKSLVPSIDWHWWVSSSQLFRLRGSTFSYHDANHSPSTSCSRWALDSSFMRSQGHICRWRKSL